MSARHFAVIGAGLAGASVAWQLARRGHDVVVFERTTPANPWGSSHGSARIFRYAYPDPFYTRLVQDARVGWDELETLSNETLITRTGALDFGALRDPQQLRRGLDSADVASELLDVESARERWPGIAFDGPVLWHDSAGVLDAQGAVDQMLTLARVAGAQVLADWPAARVRASRFGYSVESEAGQAVDVSDVVIAAGGWLPDLLSSLDVADGALSAFPTLEVRQEQAMHFPYRDETDPWPTFIHKSSSTQIYGLPGGRDAEYRGHKVAVYNAGPVIPSASHHQRVIDPVRAARLVDYVRSTLPGLVPEPYAATTCLFTNTPDEDFVIDRVDGITIVSPCSGHGAKFAPIVGELAARLATGDGEIPSRFRPLVRGRRP